MDVFKNVAGSITSLENVNEKVITVRDLLYLVSVRHKCRGGYT